MMTHAILAGTRVLRLVTEGEAGAVLLVSPQAHWPEAPHDGAELRCVEGELHWHDLRAVDTQRADRWAAIKQHRQALDNQPIAHAGFELDADGGSRADVMGAIMAMQLTGQTSRLWRCADNVMRELTLADLIAIGTGIAARRQQLIETSDALWQQLQAASTSAEVAAVQWPST